MLKWIFSIIIYYVAFYIISVLTNFCPCDNKLNDLISDNLTTISASSYWVKTKDWINRKIPQKKPATKQEIQSNDFIESIINNTVQNPDKYSEVNTNSSPPAILTIIEQVKEKLGVENSEEYKSLDDARIKIIDRQLDSYNQKR